MNIVILTTDTPCHRQFVDHIGARASVSAFAEDERPPTPWWAEHEIDERRVRYEMAKVGVGDRLGGPPLLMVKNINDHAERIAAKRPDVVIVYGTGKLSPEVIATCPLMFNLHGGDAEKYRGLDSAYWAIYWGDFDAIAVTLHRVEPTLDTGEIVGVRKLLLRKGMQAHELRAEAALICNGMVSNLLQRLEDGKPILSTPQITRGRYFSFMPGCLKSHVERKFREHVMAAL